MALTISSTAFDQMGRIPAPYSRDGANVSPPLNWRGVPPETRSFVLVVEDPDAPSGTFRHWAIYNLPADATGLPEGASGHGLGGASEGVNGFGHSHYDGPQPPRGHGTHHYHFRLAALDIAHLSVQPPARVEDVWVKARPHIIAETELVGTFAR